MQEINLKLKVEDANLILEGLGMLPFAKVYTLVAKIQEQAADQLNPKSPGKEDSQPLAQNPKGGTQAHG